MRVRFPSSRPAGNIQLEGRLHLPNGDGPHPGVVLCHPHPAGGGQMDVPLLSVMADFLCSRGFAVLRFNFAGVGGSEGHFTDGAEEPGDVFAACEYLARRRESKDGPPSVGGWSFGSWMGLTALVEGLEAGLHVAVSPPLVAYDWRVMAERLGRSEAERHYVAGDRDQFCQPGTLREFAAAVRAGEEDNVHVVDKADHFLAGREAEVARTVERIIARTS